MANSYVFNEVAKSYDLTHMILYDLSRPQWGVGLGEGLGWCFCKNSYELATL